MTTAELSFAPSQTMFRSVHTENSPHGHVVVWESLYPQDKGEKYRYMVTLDGKWDRILLEAFSRDGFISSFGMTRAEAKAKVLEIQSASIATQHQACSRDQTLKGIRERQFRGVAGRYL